MTDDYQRAAEPNPTVGKSNRQLTSADIARAQGGSIQGSSSIAIGDATHVSVINPVGEIIADLAKAQPGDVQRIAASQIELLTSYYNAVLAQARRSFTWALVAAGVGLAFFVGAVAFLLYTQSSSVAVPIAAVSVIGGALVEVIAGINFWLYSKTTAQLAAFHQHLDQTQRFLLANSICEALEGETKQTVRASLVHVIANPNLKP